MVSLHEVPGQLLRAKATQKRCCSDPWITMRKRYLKRSLKRLIMIRHIIWVGGLPGEVEAIHLHSFYVLLFQYETTEHFFG